MNLTQPIDLHDVDSYWKSRKLVDDAHRPYYIRWLQRFLTGPGGDPRLGSQDAQRSFIEHLEHGGQTPQWQVAQASRAVDLFLKHYLRYKQESVPVSQSPSVASEPSSATPATIETARAELCRLVRLRH